MCFRVFFLGTFYSAVFILSGYTLKYLYIRSNYPPGTPFYKELTTNFFQWDGEFIFWGVVGVLSVMAFLTLLGILLHAICNMTFRVLWFLICCPVQTMFPTAKDNDKDNDKDKDVQQPYVITVYDGDDDDGGTEDEIKYRNNQPTYNRDGTYNVHV